MSHTVPDLDLVFGSDSIGATPEERSVSSNVRFVRSQLQLAPYSEGATGRQLTAHEALEAFGWETVRQAACEGSVPLIKSATEPALTLRQRRKELGLSVESVAHRVGSPPAAVTTAETPGRKTPIRMLEAIGQALALDERKLGFSPNAGGDSVLGVRLREMASSGDIAGFTPGTVLQLTEAAWVIARQAAMQLSIGQDAEPRVRLPQHEPSFAYPTFDIGYRLAKKTRQILGIYDDAPIASVRMLIEDEFALPLVQQKMHKRFAGATIANGRARGIVVNETGMNANVWVRRMTLCHELGHLLWDPDDRLQRVMVDEYADIEQSDRDLQRDSPEIRANAFAVAFLAPPDAVRAIAGAGSDPIAIVEKVMTAFGISATAAKRHVCNITGLDTLSYRHARLPDPDDSWVAMENLTLDFFPVHSTHLSRRGKFAWCVAKLFEMGKITLDTAASQLGSPAGEVTAESLARVLDLRGGE